MALVKCSECGGEVSDKAPACPKCGAPTGTSASQLVAVSQSPAQKEKKKGGVRPFTIILLVALAAAAYLSLRASGKTVTTAVSGPETLFSESVVLKEGQGRHFSFTLPSSRRVELSVTAQPKSVNAFMMDGGDYAAYEKSRKPGGGKFAFVGALSGQQTVRLSQAGVLPAGTWHFVVERPNEAVLFGDDTTASIKLVAF